MPLLDLWHLATVGAVGPRRGGNGVIVGVLDTGVAPHRELPETRVDFCDVYGNGPGAPRRDRRGHGTHVCSLIAGEVCGVAPGARLAVANVLERDGGDLNVVDPETLAPALRWMVGAGADIINASLTVPEIGPDLEDALLHALRSGVFVVAAIGNQGEAVLPGSLPELLGVGATDRNDSVWRHSGSGLGKPDLSAPGAGVQAAAPTHSAYEYRWGTSMAAAIVSGVAANLLSVTPGLRRRPDLLRAELMNRTKSLSDPRGGRGRIWL